MEANDDEYEKFLQDLADGTVSLDDFILPEEIERKQDIDAISTLVQSWSQPNLENERKQVILDFEDQMEPNVNELTKASELVKITNNNIYSRQIKDFYAKKIYDIIYSFISKFEYIQDAKNFLVDTKFTKNEWKDIGVAIGIDPNRKYPTRTNIIYAIFDLFDDLNLQQKPKRKKSKSK